MTLDKTADSKVLMNIEATPAPQLLMCPCRKRGSKTTWKKGDLIYIRYVDHVLFRNADPSLISPSVRESIGWVTREDAISILIVWDRSLKSPSHEKLTPESGLLLLKDDIQAMKRFTWNLPSKVTSP